MEDGEDTKFIINTKEIIPSRRADLQSQLPQHKIHHSLMQDFNIENLF